IRDASILITIQAKRIRANRPSTSLLEYPLKSKKNRCASADCARLPGQRKHCCPSRRPPWFAAPAWPECRAWGGASIGGGTMPTQREDGNGQTAKQQARKGRDQGGYRRDGQAGSHRRAPNPTAPSAGALGGCGGVARCFSCSSNAAASACRQQRPL